MSFLFGNAFKGAGGGQNGGPPSIPPPSSGGGGSGDDGRKPPEAPKQAEIPGVPGSFANFDPSGLERAAKAMKELNSSQHASHALDLSKKQEQTRQMEFQAQIKEYEAHTEEVKLHRSREEQEQKRKNIQLQAEEKRRYLQAESEECKKRSQYDDQLARRRADDHLASQNRAKAEQLKMQQRQEEERLQRERQLEAEKMRQHQEQLKSQEESVKRQEAMRRATIEHEADLKHKNEMKQIEAKIRGKAQADRENREINLEKLRLQAKEDRTTMLEAIETRGKLIKDGVVDFITDWGKVSAAITGLSMLALGVYTARGVTSVATKYAEARIGKPKLVRETSRLNMRTAVRHPIRTGKHLLENPSDVLKDIIFKPELAQELRNVTASTVNTRRNRGMYRNLLFYGPPGTGKTLFAKSLARRCKMDYAIMTGGDVLPMGKDGVTAIHQVFDWATTSRRGLLLFVDEGDAFLRHRTAGTVNEDLRSALNAFLYRTGGQSNKFMLVLATNKPADFDRAIEDRLDDMIHFDLPSLDERQALVEQYFQEYVVKPITQRSLTGTSSRKINTESIPNIDQKLREVAVLTEGLSGREIAKLAVAWQASAFANENYTLTEEAFDDRVQRMLEQHKLKDKWMAEHEKETAV